MHCYRHWRYYYCLFLTTLYTMPAAAAAAAVVGVTAAIVRSTGVLYVTSAKLAKDSKSFSFRSVFFLKIDIAKKIKAVEVSHRDAGFYTAVTGCTKVQFLLSDR